MSFVLCNPLKCEMHEKSKKDNPTEAFFGCNQTSNRILLKYHFIVPLYTIPKVLRIIKYNVKQSLCLPVLVEFET